MVSYTLLAAMGIAVAVFNALPGILFPLALTPPGSNLIQMLLSVECIVRLRLLANRVSFRWFRPILHHLDPGRGFAIAGTAAALLFSCFGACAKSPSNPILCRDTASSSGPSQSAHRCELRSSSGPRARSAAAARASLVALGIVPVWLASGTAFFSLWPWDKAFEHLVVLALLGGILAALCLHGLHKIPFTCAYLPGTSHIHITLALCMMLGLNILFWAAVHERPALFDTAQYLRLVGILAVAAVVSWMRLFADRHGMV